MSKVLAHATKHKLICENVARRVVHSAFTTKDVRVLEKALKELEQLQLGPKLWKDPTYPCLRQVPAVTPHLETLRRLVQEHKAGCAAYCAAWLGMLVNRDVQEEFWRLAEAIDRTGAEAPEA